METLGEMWALPVVGGFILLGVVLAFAMMWNGRRDRSKDPVGEAATRQLYDETRAGDPARENPPEARPEAVKRGDQLPPRPI